jgi:hypothetical protein
MRFLLTAAALLLASTPSAHAQNGFAPIPAEQTGGTPTGLELRITGYDGATNGEIEVEVRNPTRQPVGFLAKGLYFVPAGDPNSAPQRLGAVGPFAAETPKGWQKLERLVLEPGTTTKMKIDVYCIDSHRASPSSKTAFRIANGRVPKPIVEAIDKDAAKAADPVGGVASPAAKGAVQSAVWKNRDKKWIVLDGEGAQEKSKR